MENNKLSSDIMFYLRPPFRKVFCHFGSALRRVSSSIRQFFEKLMRDMEFGFATKYTIDLFTYGVISKDEMLTRINVLERKFNKS